MSGTIYYHYTTIASCLSILSTRSVWLSDYKYLNDKHELVHAVDKFFVHFAEDERAALREALMWHQLATHHCVLSLSRSPKILSQWRAYADDGKGVAIGFNEKFLRFEKIELVPCVYEDHEKFAEEIAIRYSGLAREAREVRRAISAKDHLIGWADGKSAELSSMIRDLIALKNPAFEEEQEVRAVIPVTRDKAKLRCRGDLIVPYTEAQFWDREEMQSHMFIVIPEIWIGPRCHELNINSLASVMALCHIQRYDCGYI